MKRSTSFPVIGSILATILTLSCSQVENKNGTAVPNAAPAVQRTSEPVASPISTPSGPPPSSQVKSLPPEGGDVPRPAEFNGYSYAYKKDATKTVATFAAKLLPADNDLIFGAVRDVIARSYGDKVGSAPRLAGSGASQTLRIAGKKHEYVIVPVSDPNGKIRALIITQMD